MTAELSKYMSALQILYVNECTDLYTTIIRMFDVLLKGQNKSMNLQTLQNTNHYVDAQTDRHVRDFMNIAER